MDAIHDMGGMHGFGEVVAEPDEPVFHAEWERRTMPLVSVLVVNGLANASSFRHAIERMEPAHYLSSPYYEHWLTAVATLVVEAGLSTPEELADLAGGDVPLSAPVAVSGEVSDTSVADPPPGSPPRRASAGGSPALAVGAAVRVRNLNRPGHTRCPRYVRGHVGTVVRVDPPSPLPDVEAHRPDAASEPVYCVRFEASELWGGDPGADDAPVGGPRPSDASASAHTVYVNLWASYLRPLS